MHQRFIKLGAFFSLASFCLALWFFFGQSESRAQREKDVYEAVFRRLMELPDVGYYPRGDGVCISDDQNRFDSQFLNRFHGQFPGLRLAARPVGQQAPNTAKRPSGKQCKILISAGKIIWVNAREATVDGGYYCGMLCAWGGQFHVRRAGWGWYVDSTTESFISNNNPSNTDLSKSNSTHLSSGSEFLIVETLIPHFSGFLRYLS